MSKGLESWKYLCSNGFVDIPIPKGNETDKELDDYAIGCGFTIEKELKRLEWYDNLGKPISGILPKKQDYRLNQLLNSFEYIDRENIRSLCQERYEEIIDIIDKNETNKKTLEVIEENLKYGYVFIGYDKDHKPLFQFADTKLYEEIKKNMTY